jgi:hypothetical protein
VRREDNIKKDLRAISCGADDVGWNCISIVSSEGFDISGVETLASDTRQ